MGAKYNQDFFKIWSPDMAYILGFTIGDGCIHNYSICFNIQKDDIEVLEYIKNKIAPERKIYNLNGQIYLSLNSKSMVADLQGLGIKYRKTGKEFYPSVPEEYKFDFLRGLIDSDGCIKYYNYRNANGRKRKEYELQIAIANKKFLKEINKHICFGLGTIHKHDGIYLLRFWKRIDILKILKLTYETPYFCLKRKYEKYKSIPEPKTFKAFGEEKTLKEWAKDKRCKVSRILLYERVCWYGKDLEYSLTTKKRKRSPNLTYESK